MTAHLPEDPSKFGCIVRSYQIEFYNVHVSLFDLLYSWYCLASIILYDTAKCRVLGLPWGQALSSLLCTCAQDVDSNRQCRCFRRGLDSS